jgi:SAM-dependent methyltransferase
MLAAAMRVFVAGATGALGAPLVRTLVAARHEVVGLTRSAAKTEFLRALGARAAVADALDAAALRAAVVESKPHAVVHALTALPPRGPLRVSDLRLPFSDAAFDAVTVSYGLHELPAAVRERTLREVARVLRPEGCLVSADLDRPPRLGWLVDLYLRLGEPANARAVLGDGLARLIRSAGFAVEREGPRGRVPMQLLVARRAPQERSCRW